MEHGAGSLREVAGLTPGKKLFYVFQGLFSLR